MLLDDVEEGMQLCVRCDDGMAVDLLEPIGRSRIPVPRDKGTVEERLGEDFGQTVDDAFD